MGDSWGYNGPAAYAPLQAPLGHNKKLSSKPPEPAQPPPRTVVTLKAKIAEFKRRRAAKRRS